MRIFTGKKVGYGYCWNLSLLIKIALKAISRNVVFGERSMKEETKILSGTSNAFLFSLIMLFHK